MAMVHQKTLTGPRAEERQAMLERTMTMWGDIMAGSITSSDSDLTVVVPWSPLVSSS